MTLPQPNALKISTVASAQAPSPLLKRGDVFVDDTCRVLACSNTRELQPYWDAGQSPPSFEVAGPRAQIAFEPERLTCGIVTCGGLCPGLNDVIRSIVLGLTYAYGVRRILGFRYGYAGLSPHRGFDPMALTPERVDHIHEQGGTLLGSSRGPQDVGEMVDTLVRHDVSILFAIGGDGTLRGASAIAHEAMRRNLRISVIGVPKTIDNDIEWIWKSFGFSTAVEEARRALAAAHNEARGAWNGIGLVKLMGRHSGFIAATATLANSDVNFCLVPEAPFVLKGEGGFLQALERRLQEKRHAVIAVAEGAGQDILQDPAHQERDTSGNLRLKDVGIFVRDEMIRYFRDREIEVSIKYIDPSYSIRSLPANGTDSEYCLLLGQHAVHAGMAGRTDMVVGYWNQMFTHVPIAVATAGRKTIDPSGEIWQRVLQATGQPAVMLATAAS